jgi:hypothetical protein
MYNPNITKNQGGQLCLTIKKANKAMDRETNPVDLHLTWMKRNPVKVHKVQEEIAAQEEAIPETREVAVEMIQEEAVAIQAAVEATSDF